MHALRSVLRVQWRPNIYAFHTATPRPMAFDMFNPWAKKTPTETEKQPSVGDTDKPVTVTYYEEEERIPSWKNQTVMTDPEQIRTAIRSIVLDKVPNVNDSNWESANLELDDVKFKVVKESIKQTGKEVSNLQLNNMNTVSDLLAHFLRQETHSSAESSVEQFFKNASDSLPPNMSFAPRTKRQTA